MSKLAGSFLDCVPLILWYDGEKSDLEEVSLSDALQEAIAALNLKPGQVDETVVDDQAVEIRVLEPDEKNDRPLPATDEAEMVNIVLAHPQSPSATAKRVSHVSRLLPTPIEIDETDLTPE